MIDVLVAGGGPAGLATAIGAAGAGLEAVVVEPRPGPVDKACGEGLMPGALAALAALGVDAPGRPFTGIRYVQGGWVADARFRLGPGRGVRRTALHAALAARAADVGVRVVAGRVEGVRQGPGWVAAAGLRARYLVAADGLHSPVRRALGLDRPPRGPARRGLRRHFAVAPWTDCVEVHWSAQAEAYVTPVADDLVGVAVLFSGVGDLDHWLTEFPVLGKRLAEGGAVPAGDVRGAGPFEQRVARRVAGRVLLVGDAAGYVDALTGEGVNLALAAASAAVEAIRADRPEAYEPAWRHLSRRYRLLTAGLLWARREPVLAPRIVPAAARCPRVFAAAVNRLA